MNHRGLRGIVAVSIMSIGLSLAGRGALCAIHPGDLLIGNILAPGGPCNMLVVDPTTGEQSLFPYAVGYPTGIAFSAEGRLFVTDRGVVEINPVTGAGTVLTSGGSLVAPEGLAIASNGDFFLLNGSNAFGAPTAVVRLSVQTGAQSVVSSGGLLTEPTRLAVEANGNIVVTNGRFTSASAVLRINPMTGAQSVVSSGGNLYAPTGIAVDASGRILVADELYASGIVRIDPVTGAQNVVSSRGLLAGSQGIAIAASGDLLVTVLGPSNGMGGVVRVNPVTGAQASVSAGGSFWWPVDIAIAPGGPTPVERTTWGGLKALYR
jgi:streptogramin lyase